MSYKRNIFIGEHSIELPELPKDKKKIFFYDEDDPCWDRNKIIATYKEIWFDFIPHFTKVFQDATLYDNDNNLVSLNQEDSNYIIETYTEEMRRRREGIHFKNGKEITYITGDHYFVLVWCKTKRPDKRGEWFDYREFQAQFFYLIKYVNDSALILGLFISKAKKTGITNLMWLYYLNKATMTKNINLGNMNIDQDKGAKTFRDHFMYAYNSLPRALKAEIKSKSDTEGRVNFGKQNSNSKKNRMRATDADDELYTTVMCVPTMPHAFDVDVFDSIWFDEPPKYKTDFGEIYRSNKAGTSIQDDIIGKIFLTSYTPDENSPSFISAKDLYYDSELRTVTIYSNGQTKSKLICYHIPAYMSWTTSFDRYGRCNEVEAMQKIKAGREMIKDRPKELQALTRQYANDKREAWSLGGSGSTFDPIRLGDMYADVEEEERSGIEAPYIEGDLLWEINLWNIGLKNKRRKGEFCKLRFVPLTDEQKERGVVGKFRFYEPIHPLYQNYALSHGRDEYGNLLAPKQFLFVGGGDPTQYAAGSEVTAGSKNALYTLSIPNEMLDNQLRKIATKKIVCEYYYRPELPDEAFEDFLKLIIYTGQLSLIEANAPYVATRLMEEGLGNYMIVKDTNDFFTVWKRWMGMSHEADKQYKLIRISSNSQMSKEMLETLIRVIKNYMEKPEAGGKDYGKTIKSLRLIKQLQEFNPMDTRLSDLVMAWGYTLLALDIYLDMMIQGETYVLENEYANVLRALAS